LFHAKSAVSISSDSRNQKPCCKIIGTARDKKKENVLYYSEKSMEARILMGAMKWNEHQFCAPEWLKAFRN